MALVEVDVGGSVARVTLARPERRNAMSVAMVGQLAEVLGGLAARPGVRAVLLGGEGPDFCAGADFEELEAMGSHPDPPGYSSAVERALIAVTAHPTPVIAQVHGAALGAGCQLAVACDLVVAAEDARFGIPAARLGIVINFENVERLVLAVGPKRAGEILFTGRIVSGTLASAWGLVNEAVPAGELGRRASELSAAVADAAPLSVRASKRGIGVVLEHLSIDRSAEAHRVVDYDGMLEEALVSEDVGEGLRAFRERRRPQLRGR